MNVYKCIVYNEKMKRKSLKINLDSMEDLKEYALSNNLRIVKIKNLKRRYINEKLSDSETKVICKQMSVLLQSGCEITKLFSILVQESSNKISDIISKIHNHIQLGNSISESFLVTNLFSNFFINMVKAGEVTGSLDMVLENLSDYYEKESALKSKISNMLIYPSILMIITSIVTMSTIIFIIPSFQMVFQNNGIEPPLSTKIFIDISVFIREYIIYFMLMSIAFIMYSVYYIKNNIRAKQKINEMMFKTPHIKDVIKIIITIKFSRALYILINSGIQIIEAIQISSNVLDNQFASERLEIGIEYIKRGNSIGESLSLTNVFPNMFISMVKIGEESGKLDETLKAINKYYESEFDVKVEKLMSYIQPAIIVILGLVVGSILISIVTPMFDIVNSI